MIITLSQVKDLLNITSTAKDALISALIPEAEAKYLQIRNYPFDQFYGSITNGSKTITDIVIYPSTVITSTSNDYKSTASYIDRMSYVYNSEYNIDNYVTAVNETSNSIEIDTAAEDTVANIVLTVYPQGAKLTAAKIVQYMMSSNSMNGMQSESIGSYSYSRGTTGNPHGVPDDIVKSIKRYINV